MAGHLGRIGQQIGDYRLLRWLGRGGFGDVYLAEHVRDHSQVAIKLLHIQLSSNKELKAFINEARTIRLQHPHIVPLLDFGISQEEIPYLVMEYAAGGTLYDRHPKGSHVPLPQVLDYARQIGSALQYAHEQRLIHRDVKPQNMLLREDGTLLLSDFGLVAVIHSSDSLSPHQEAAGTLVYMAPEQVPGQVQAASDQYSLAVVVYEWITGCCPFEGTFPQIVMQHVMKPPPSLVAQVPGLARAVEEVVLKALAKDPKERFVSVQAFTAALGQAIHTIPNEHKTPSLDHNEQILSPSGHEQDTAPAVPGPRAPAASNPQVDWGDALAVPTFYGREQEIAQLTQWIVQERCRVVSVLGMGGIGKSALSVSLISQLSVGRPHPRKDRAGSSSFEVVIFRSLRDAPALDVLLDDCLQVLSPQLLSRGPDTLEKRLSLLLEHLRKTRVLVVLDNMEGLLEEGDVRGHFRRGFEAYEQLLRQVSERGHQSCLLFTSREKPAKLKLLEGKYPQVRSLRLAGLDVAACKQILGEKEVRGTSPEQERLIEIYGGNPLALKIVVETIVDLFGGEIGPFLAAGPVLFSSITELLDEQFARLSAQEQCVLCWLAIVREPVTLDELQALLVFPMSRMQVLDAVDGLRRRSLIEPGKHPGSFSLQSVVLEYVTAHLVAEGSREIKLGRLHRLIGHGLELAHCKEYVRQTQERLLLSPLLADLQGAVGWGQAPSLRQTDLEEQLLDLLDELREWADVAQGYGPTNLIALLRALRGNLNGLDLSHLCIRGAYLQSVDMHDTSLAFALIRDTILTEAINATWAVATSLDGRWWAAGSIQGKVCVWQEGGQTSHLILSAHTYAVQSLAFSPDGRTLGSGGADGTVKLWDVESSSLLWMGWHKNPLSVAFTPDGSLLASAGADATVRLWDTKTGRNVQTLMYAGQACVIAFSPDGRLLVSGSFDGELRFWEMQKTESLIWVEIHSIKTSWITSLVFAPDGRTMASGHQDHTVRLWEVESFRLLHTLEDLQAKYLAWSPDGRSLAGSGSGKTICVYNVEQGRIRSVLHGHASDIHAIAFASNSRQLLSGSSDGTLRVWNVESHECVRIIAGYGFTLLDLDWSPDGTHLVSGGTDNLVTIWYVSGGTLPTVLRGHTWLVFGVGWSPDGKSVASCGWDKTIRLWNPTTHTSVQKFEDSLTLLLCVAWSPDGSWLACGTYRRGIQMWDVRTGSLRWIGQPYLLPFYRVTWKPDGTQVASCGDDGCVYLWESANGTLLQRLSGHRGWVVSVVWSPDGTRLASGSYGEGSGELFIWNVENGERLRTFIGHSGQVCAVVWSPSGDQLISGDSDGMLRWWDVKTAECVMTRAAHEGAIRALRVSPNGRWLASCGDDGAISIWDLGNFAHVRTLRRDRPYERLNITGIRGLNETQKDSLRALGAIETDVVSFSNGNHSSL